MTKPTVSKHEDRQCMKTSRLRIIENSLILHRQSFTTYFIAVAVHNAGVPLCADCCT